MPVAPLEASSCCLDALYACICAVAWHLGPVFFSASTLGSPVSRQLAFELQEMVNGYNSWLNVPIRLSMGLRDQAREGLGDIHHFVDRPVVINSEAKLDRLDRHVISRDLVDWCLVRRRTCEHCCGTHGTFAKGMRGLWIKLDSTKDFQFRNVQDMVDYVVRSSAGRG